MKSYNIYSFAFGFFHTSLTMLTFIYVVSYISRSFLIVWNLFSSSLPLQHAKHCIGEPRQYLNTCPHLHALHLGSHWGCGHEKWTTMANHSSQDASKGGKIQPSGKMGNQLAAHWSFLSGVRQNDIEIQWQLFMGLIWPAARVWRVVKRGSSQ